MNKFEFVRKVLLGGAATGDRLLDVGCRGCELRLFVEDLVRYEGLDLLQNDAGTVALVHDLSKPLPLADDSYRFVVALDVLEHLDNIEGALDELLRVSGQTVIAVLPNMAHVLHRVRFLFQGRLSAKYDMAFGAGADRHRWLPAQPSADAYMRDYAKSRGSALQVVWLVDSARREWFARASCLLGLSASLYVTQCAYVLTKGSALTPAGRAKC